LSFQKKYTQAKKPKTNRSRLFCRDYLGCTIFSVDGNIATSFLSAFISFFNKKDIKRITDTSGLEKNALCPLR